MVQCLLFDKPVLLILSTQIYINCSTLFLMRRPETTYIHLYFLRTRTHTAKRPRTSEYKRVSFVHKRRENWRKKSKKKCLSAVCAIYAYVYSLWFRPMSSFLSSKLIIVRYQWLNYVHVSMLDYAETREPNKNCIEIRKTVVTLLHTTTKATKCAHTRRK